MNAKTPKNPMKKLYAALVVIGGAALVGCNGGNSSSGGQTLTGAPLTADASKSLFTANECLSGELNFSGSSLWYVGGSISVTNTCDSELNLAQQTISFTSQDNNGAKVNAGTLNNWYINGTGYKLVFSSGNANQQVGSFSADNNNAVIKAKQTIVFSGGLNLNGVAFNNGLAQSSLTINGAGPTPTPTPSPTPTVAPSPSPSPTTSPTPGANCDGVATWSSSTAYTQAGTKVVYNNVEYSNNWWTQGDNPAQNSGVAGSGKVWTILGSCGATPTPTPTPTTTPTPAGTLNVVVDTSSAGCSGSACGSVTANVTNSAGAVVTSFEVPTAALGGKYTQPITQLTAGNYTVAGSTINNTTVSYTPSATAKVVDGSTATVTVKYDKSTPVVATGKATISLNTYVAGYTGELQVQVLNSKANDAVVGSYTLKQGGSVTTADLPVSGSDNAYRVRLSTGIADPLQGLYYIESGEPVLTINKDATTAFNLPMVKSGLANNNVTLTISGLNSGDKAAVAFSDAGNKYSYVSYANQVNGNVVYKVENGLNLGTVVTASGSNYKTNPLATTQVITAATTIKAAFESNVVVPTSASYDYLAPFKDYNNKIVLSINGIASSKSLTFTSNFQQKAGWGTCFGLSADNIGFTSTKSGTKYLNTITAKDKTNWDGSTSSQSLDLTKSCDVMGTDNGAEVLPGVIDPIVYNVTINGSSLAMAQPCAATNCKDPGNGYVNAGYYAQWAVWGRQYNPYNMPFNNINDIIYAFVGFNPATGDVKTLDASADSWGMSAVSRAMLQYPYMQAHLSFGGWTNNGINTAPMFEQLASSTTSMNNFATQAITLMRKTGYTGIDIDWEWWSDYANNVAPAKKMLAFYQTLRTALDNAGKEDGKTYTLTIAVNGGSDRILALEGKNVDGTSNGNPNAVSNFWSQVGGLMNHINVMNYDYHGSWDAGSPAYFQANYDFQNLGSNKVGKDEGWSIKSSMNTYIARGVPAKKLVAGIPLYARTMTVASATNGGLFQSVTGAGFGDYENGILDYKCIINPVNNPVTGCGSDKPIAGVKSLAFYSSTSNVTTFNQYGLDSLQPWAYSAQTNSFMTYDDQWSAVQKAKAVKATGLGGTMYWELDGDAQNAQQSIVQAVKDEYNK